MKYYVRIRGEDQILGPYSVEEMESQIKAGKLTAAHMALCDTGQTPQQLRSHWAFQWIAISSVPGLEQYVPAILKEAIVAPAPPAQASPAISRALEQTPQQSEDTTIGAEIDKQPQAASRTEGAPPMGPMFVAIRALPSLIIPTVLFFIAILPEVKGAVNLSPSSIFLLSLTYITVLYALAGGFEPSQDIWDMPQWRNFLFIALGGIGLSILLGIFWILISIGLRKLFKVEDR